MNAEPILSLARVSFGFGSETLLDEVNLTVPVGGHIGITGPTGSGKSSLLLALLGLKRITRGTIHWFGKPRLKPSDFHDVRGPAGLIFQDPDDQLFCPTVLEDVAFGPLQKGTPADQAFADARVILDQIGISHLAERSCAQLSFGQKRLACLAGVLIARPQVLLLDEPTNGLDRELVTHLLTLIKQAVPTTLLVSHDLDQLGALAQTNYRIHNRQLTRL